MDNKILVGDQVLKINKFPRNKIRIKVIWSPHVNCQGVM